MKKKKTWVILSVIIGCLLVIFGVVFFEFKDVIFNQQTFADETYINGVNVSGMTKAQAQNVVTIQMLSKRSDIKITLKTDDMVYVWTGDDFEIDNGIMMYVDNVFNYFNSGNIFEKRSKLKSNDGKYFNMSYSESLTGLDEKINKLCEQLNIEAKDAEVVFDSKSVTPLSFKSGTIGRQVDKQQLKLLIDTKLFESNNIEIEVPIQNILPNVTKIDLEKSVKKRSEFSTNYEKSSQDRKFNVRHALEAFNGLKIEPNQEISFNNTTGPRNAENGYKKANIILNGVYVEGYGGGVCQASTTLYNALLCADIEILEVNKHTLPSSYIWLGFDAMVSEGVSDLRFVNNTSQPLYIKTSCDDKNAKVEIFGEALRDNEKLVRRVEFIEAIPHPGDRIIPDTEGKYSNKVTYKGEYLRLKYPKEGYRAKAFMDRYIDGVLVESKQIRDVTYEAQEGIIIEGVEDVTEGITLPPNDVKFIPAQTKSNVNQDNVQKKITVENPPNYNP